MKRKTIALLMLVSMFLATTLCAADVSASNFVARNNVPVKVPITQTSGPAANSTSAFSPSCGSCLATVTFQNFTPWWVDCYMDGNYMGRVYPGRSLSVRTEGGWNRPYAEALFRYRSPLFWDLGDRYYYPGGSYVFPMNP